MSILYTDGGVIKKNPSKIGGTWAWVLVADNNKNFITQGSGVIEAGVETITNNQMEFYAIARGLLDCAKIQKISEVRSDSQVSLGRFFMGWGITNISDWMLQTYYQVMQIYPHKPWTHILEMKYTLLDGHPTKAQLAAGIGKRGHPVSKWNCLCDTLCNQEAQKYLDALNGKR